MTIHDLPFFGPETREKWKEQLTKSLKVKFGNLNSLHENCDLYKDYINKEKVIADIDTIMELFQICTTESCGCKCMLNSKKLEGCVLKVSWACSNGHTGFWTSSKLLCQKRGQNVYVNTILLAPGVIISGNNYEKVANLFNFLGVGFVAPATFTRLQRICIIPEIEEYWKKMKNEIWSLLSSETIILCGDGRMDSPGHSAKCGVYVLMEQFLEVIVDLVVIDKRETGGISTNMEVFGLKKLLERVVGKLILSEIVTDASSAVRALVKKMKGTVIKIKHDTRIHSH